MFIFIHRVQATRTPLFINSIRVNATQIASAILQHYSTLFVELIKTTAHRLVRTLCSCSTGVHLSSSLQILNHIIGKKKCPANEYATTSILLIYIVIYFEMLLIYQSELSVCLLSRNTLTNYHNVFSHFMIKYNLIIFGTYFNAKICWLPHVKRIARLFFLFVANNDIRRLNLKKFQAEYNYVRNSHSWNWKFMVYCYKPFIEYIIIFYILIYIEKWGAVYCWFVVCVIEAKQIFCS